MHELTKVFIRADNSLVTTANFTNAAPISGSWSPWIELSPKRSKILERYISLSVWAVKKNQRFYRYETKKARSWILGEMNQPLPELWIALMAFLIFDKPSRSISTVCNKWRKYELLKLVLKYVAVIVIDYRSNWQDLRNWTILILRCDNKIPDRCAGIWYRFGRDQFEAIWMDETFDQESIKFVSSSNDIKREHAKP